MSAGSSKRSAFSGCMRSSDWIPVASMTSRKSPKSPSVRAALSIEGSSVKSMDGRDVRAKPNTREYRPSLLRAAVNALPIPPVEPMTTATLMSNTLSIATGKPARSRLCKWASKPLRKLCDHRSHERNEGRTSNRVGAIRATISAGSVRSSGH